MKTVIPSVKGTRDFYPETMAIRNWLYRTARLVAGSFGYQEYEGPLLESIDLYAAKSGDELVKEQSFVFPDRAGNLITLRPELTPTLARMVAQRQKQLAFPLRWWSFGPFWRYEQPQKGRSREFFQWNVDLIGTTSSLADAELVAVVASFFSKTGLTPDDVQILVNDRYLMETELISLDISTDQHKQVFRLIDRREKLSAVDWSIAATEMGLNEKQVSGLESLLVNQGLWKKSEGLPGFFSAISALGFADYVTFSPQIIRGLDYYTGIVFEARAMKSKLVRAILGGGRYDNLLSDVGGETLPAIGFAMGDVVISILLEEMGLIPDEINSPPAQILITIFDETTQLRSLEFSAQLRQAGVNAITYPQADKLGKQLKYADRIGMEFVVVIGPDEIINNAITIKNLSKRTQETIAHDRAILRIFELLEKQPPS